MNGLLLGGIIGEGLNSFVQSYNASQDQMRQQAEADEDRAMKRRQQKLQEADLGVKYNPETDSYDDINEGRLNRAERQRVDQINKSAVALGDQWGRKEYDVLRQELKDLLTKGTVKPTGMLPSATPPQSLLPAPTPTLTTPKATVPQAVKKPVVATPKAGVQAPGDEYEKMAREIETAPIAGYNPAEFSVEPKWVREEKLNRAKRAQEVRLKGKEKGVSQSTDGQANAAGFAFRVEEANNIFDDLEKSGFDRSNPKYEFQEDVASLPLVGKYTRSAQDERLVRQAQAERNFINAVLRRESGASIAPAEFSSAEQQYFPRPGDTDEVKKQKRQNRLTALANLRAGAGPKAMAQMETERAAVAQPVAPIATPSPTPTAKPISKVGPGSIISHANGKKYRVGADGDSLIEVK